MSVIFGLFNRKGSPVSDEINVMYDAMKRFPHESHSIIHRENCAFGHMLTYNTPEARFESMPVWLEEAQLLFTCEGRLDNRDELFEALGIPPSERLHMADGTLMLKTYLKWGEDCIHRFLGKWSLAAFDTKTQDLFVARDKFDYTCLFFSVNEEYVAFASSNYGLTALPFVGDEINLETFAGLMVIIPTFLKQHLYKNVTILEASHFAKFSREKESCERYWSFYDWMPDRTRKWSDHVEEMFHVFNLAVQARLRSDKPVAGTLSGGLDSSTVCYLAAEHLAKEGKRLTTYTHVPRFAPTTSLSRHNFGDEKPFVEDIVKASGHIDPVYLDSSDITVLEGIERGFEMAGGVIPAVVNAYWLVDIYSKAQEEGIGSILLGDFGNTNISWAVPNYMLPMSILYKRYGFWPSVKKKYLYALLFGDNSIGRIYKGTMRRKDRWQKRSYLTESFCGQLDIKRHMKSSDVPSDFLFHFANPIAYRNMLYRRNTTRLRLAAHMGLFCGLEVRDPCVDVRVIEAFMKIPHEMFFQEENRWLVRDMMKGRLPDSVRLNAQKGRQSADVGERLYTQREKIETKIQSMKYRPVARYVDVERLERDWKAHMSECEDENSFDIKSVFTMMRHVSADYFFRE